MQCKAVRGGWPYQDVAGGGGKNGTRREYFFHGLPLPLKAAILDSIDAFVPSGPTALSNEPQKTALPAATRAQAALSPYMEKLLARELPAPEETRLSYSMKQCMVADARLTLLRWVARRAAELEISLHAAHEQVFDGTHALPASLGLTAAIANDRNGFKWRLEINAQGQQTVAHDAERVPAHIAVLPPAATFFRWAQRYNEKGWVGLVPKYKERDMRPPAWADAFLKVKQTPQNPTVANAVARMVLPAGMDRPKVRAVQKWYADKFSRLDRERGRRTGSALNPYKFAHKRTTAGMLPGDEVHSDGWGTHFTAPHPVSQKFVKLEVWHSHDVATRYVYPPSVGLSESATVILKSIASVFAVDGVPAVWQTDNTGSVKNERMEFDPAGSIAARAGMTIVHNLPGNSQANGIAEEFNRYLDARSKELATYQARDMDPLTGKRVLRITQKMVAAATREEALALRAEAERIGKGMVFESYQQAVDWLRQICAEYNDRPHRSLPVIATETGRRHMSPNEMRARFVEAGLWKPSPVATEALADLMHPHERKTVVRATVSVYGQRYHSPDLEHVNGRQVLVAYDINDGERVWVKDLEDGRLLCEAKIYESRSYRTQSFMEIALEKRADGQQKRLQKKIDDIEVQRPGALIEGVPARPRDLPAKPRLIAAELQPFMDQAEELQAPAVNVHALSESGRHRYWETLDARRSAGEQLRDDEESFWSQWQTGGYFRAQVGADQEFELALSRRAAGAQS